VPVSGAGTIELPLVGGVQAAGRNPGELVDELTKKLSAFVRNPQVDIVARQGR